VRDLKVDPPTALVVEELARALVTEALIPHRGNFLGVNAHIAHPTDISKLDVQFEISKTGVSISDAALVAAQVHDLLGQALRGARTQVETASALQRKQLAMLVGQPESEWMEVKAAPYRLDTDRGKLELAKDVAAFANRPEGGVIVLGLETRKNGGKDVIRRVRLFDLALIDVSRYRNILNQYVFPPVSQMEIKALPVHGNKGFAFIRVPPQPPESKPLLVIGHLVEGRRSTTYLSLPVRAGDSVEFRNPASLHSLLVAGRIAIVHAEDAASQSEPDDQ
jgi:hypothetical protein